MQKLVWLLLTLLVGGAAGAYYWFQANFNQQQAEVLSVQPLFHPMEKFVMSVASDPNSRYLVLELTLVSHKASTIEALKEATPLLRNVLVEHFATTSHMEVKVAMQQVGKVQDELLAKFNKALADNKYEHQLDKVLITNMFIQ